jgi:hypothetical protein
MKAFDILEENPIAKEIIRDHYINLLEDSLKSSPNLPENFREFLRDRCITDKELISMIDGNPRVLVDVFDDNEIHACLDMTFKNGKPVFKININGALSGNSYTERKEAEKEMMFECIKLLNSH